MVALLLQQQTDRFKALICFVNKLIYTLMGDNGFGDNGRVHAYYSN